MFQAHPERAASLLAKIPRLDGVAAMIQKQQRPGSVGDAALEAGILQLAMEFDRKIYRGMAPASALAELRSSRRFDSRALDALGAYSPADEEYDVRRIPIRELRVGMILESDVISMDGNLLILKQGTVLTETWLERLENFSRVRGAQEFVNARVPRAAGRQ